LTATVPAAPVARYRALLRIPQMRSLLGAAFVGRLGVGMIGLSLVLLVSRATGSYAIAGLVVAVQSIAAGVTTPFLGRLMDRIGQTAILVACSVIFPCAVAALVVVAQAEPRTPLLVVCAVAFGGSYPPIFAALRTLLSKLGGSLGLAETAFALEAIMQELLFIVGPLTVAVSVALASPQVALAVLAAFTATGTLAFAALEPSRRWRSDGPPAGQRQGVLSSAGMRTVLVVSATFGIAFGTLEVALPAFCADHGSQSTSGVLLAALGVGSMVGGIVYGGRSWRTPPHLLYILFGALFAVAMVPIALADSIALLFVLMPLAGLVVAPGAAISYGLISHLTPAGTISEAFTWETTAVIAGFSFGGAVSGVLVEGPGVRAALLFATVLAATSPAIAWGRRRTLAGEAG
jgi:MFS family permease